jgi:N-acetylmuramic acid 6-phosphate etherase
MSDAALANLPPDRSHVATERRHPRSLALDAMDARAIVDLMIDDHAAVIDALREGAAALAKFIDDLVARMQRGGRLIYLGAGTSGRLGVLDASECPPTFQSDPAQVVGIIAGGDAALRKSSEGKEDEADGAREALAALKLTGDETVLGIAAGGTTPYVLGGLGIAKASGATTGLLTCSRVEAIDDSTVTTLRAQPTGSQSSIGNRQSSIPSHPPIDHLIVLLTGPEVLTGSTRLKAGSATKLALNIITTAAFVRLGKTYSNLMVDVRATNQKLADRAIRILVEVCPELTREGAADLLGRAGGSLKAAIVMQRLDADVTQAQGMLREHQGSLRAILD